MQQLTTNTLLRGGTYKIGKVLGQGSFGITYLAEHTALGKKVCIKEFFMKELNSRGDDGSITGLSDGSLSYNYAQKFRKEAQNLARMEHPNIVRVTDSFDENATFYYVMEYIEGQDLNTYIKQHALSESEAVAIIKDVANALIYMHDEKRMLHLDLKPGNVMRRNSDGHIFLIDFGLSKNYDTNGAPETSTTIGLGTAGYAPIEQANQAKNGEFRPTIDVYALGATLYKLLTRETPPPASELVTDDELISDKLKEHNVSDAISSVVVNAMLPNVRKRTQTIKAFVDVLQNCTTSNIVAGLYQEDNEETQIIVPSVKDEFNLSNTSQKSDATGNIVFNVNGVYFNMIKVEAGSFIMGATSQWGSKDERPAHQVVLTNSYYIGETQVTQALWKAVMGNNPSTFKGDDHPVEQVNWSDCQEFIRVLNQLTGRSFRLPTEAEWEFAAKGGNNSNHYYYSGSNNKSGVARERSKTYAVATMRSNELGIYDMSGNVEEWCQDWYGNYSKQLQTNPTGPTRGNGRVIRGGWFISPSSSSGRFYRDPDLRSCTIGFRLALSE